MGCCCKKQDNGHNGEDGGQSNLRTPLKDDTPLKHRKKGSQGADFASSFSKANYSIMADSSTRGPGERNPALYASMGGTSPSKHSPADFIIHKVIGKGAYGLVYLVSDVRESDPNKLYAMKVVEKKLLSQKNQVIFIEREKGILSIHSHPFIVNLRCAFQDNDSFYLILEYLPGGDLYTYLRKEKLFKEDRARFYAAMVVLAFEYLHANKIIYRDLKPENILMDAQGFIKLSDFGLSKEADLSKTFCGTPDYLAPEMLNGGVHDKNLDWWMLGILIYEMVSGKPPFTGSNQLQIYKKIQEKPPARAPEFSDVLWDLLSKLLEKNPGKRLGAQDDTAVRHHPFFKGINWDKLHNQDLEPPFKPVIAALDLSQDPNNRPVLTKSGSSGNIRMTGEQVRDSQTYNLEGFTYEDNSFKRKLLQNLDNNAE